MSDESASCLPWVAAYVRHKHEKNVALSFQGKGITSFLPTYSQCHRNGKNFDLPLFPGYVFCRLDPHNTLPARSTPGVFSLVSSNCVPSVISDNEIEGIRQALLLKPSFQPWPYIAPGQEVRIKSGPFKGLQGVVVDESHEQWLVLSIHLLQRSVAVRVERAQVCE